MNLAEKRWTRLLAFGALFFAQGVPWGFMAITLPAYLAQHGADVAALGSISAMTVLPYAFKWVWGPVIDAVAIPGLGRRRGWILLAQVMMAVTAAGFLLIDARTSIDTVLALIFVHTVFNAMQNVAVDGLAIDLLAREERSRANGIMYGSQYGGGIVGAAGMALVIRWFGFASAIACVTLILLAIAAVPLVVREHGTGPRAEHRAIGEVVRGLVRAFSLRSPRVAAVLMLTQTIAAGMLTVVAQVLFMQKLEWDQSEYSVLSGGPGLAIGVVGSLSAAFFADKLGKRRLVALASATVAAGWLVFALNPSLWNTRPFVYALMVVEPLTQSMFTVALWSLCMDTSLKRTAATQFAAYTSLMNAGTIIGSKLLAGHVTAWWSFGTIYMVAAGIQLSTIALLPFIDPEQVRRELPDE